MAASSVAPSSPKVAVKGEADLVQLLIFKKDD